MAVSWTHARSRVAVATKRLANEGPTPDNDRDLWAARADYAAARLEVAIQRVIDDGVHLRIEHTERLNLLLEQIPVSGWSS